MTDLNLIDTDRVMHEAGFDNRADYGEWLALEGRRLLTLSLREEAERQSQVLDGEREAGKAGVVAQLRARLTRCLNSRLRLNGRVTRVHDGSPSSVGRTPKVGAAGDAAPSPRRSGGAA